MAVDDSYTKSLLHFDGDLTDESGKTWTAYGGAATSTAQKKFGTASLDINGTEKYAISDLSSDFQLGTQSFVFDWQQYRTANSSGKDLMLGLGGAAPNAQSYLLVYFTFNVTPQIQFYASSNGTSFDILSNVQPSMGGETLNEWTHWAIIRSGSSFYAAKNGTVYTLGTSASDLYNGGGTVNKLYLGRSSGADAAAYIDEVRLSVGTDRGWTTNFTPPAGPYAPPTGINLSPVCIF